MWWRSPAWDEVVWWALDLETSGLTAGRDRILSVGMVPVRGGVVRWGERVYQPVHPGAFTGLSTEAMAVHHILPDEQHRAPPLAEVLPRIEPLLAEGVLLVHYAALDVTFLRRAFRDLGRHWPRPRVVDTQDLVARLEFRRQQLDPYAEPLPRALSGIRAHLGLPTYDYHHALTDALATAELFLALRARLGLARVRQIVRR